MGKDVLSKIRTNDVYKGLVRVLGDYNIEDFDVKDERPHPKLIIRHVGLEKEFEFPGTPRRRVNVKSYVAKLRRFLQAMQMEALEMEMRPVAPSKVGQVHVPMRGSLLTKAANGQAMMSSKEIAELCEKEHKHVIRDINDMVKGMYGDGPELGHQANSISYAYDGRGYVSEVKLDKSHTITLIAGYRVDLRKRIVDRWLELEGIAVQPQPSRALTTAEMFLQTAQAMVEFEQRQAAQEERIAVIDSQVQRIQDSHYIHPECPRTAEPITKIKDRIGKKYGLSYDVITYILRESPLAPRTISIRNKHESANGAVYQAFYIKNVTDIFERFVRESKHVVGDFYEHPYIRGRFKMVLR